MLSNYDSVFDQNCKIIYFIWNWSLNTLMVPVHTPSLQLFKQKRYHGMEGRWYVRVYVYAVNIIASTIVTLK